MAKAIKNNKISYQEIQWRQLNNATKKYILMFLNFSKYLQHHQFHLLQMKYSFQFKENKNLPKKQHITIELNF